MKRWKIGTKNNIAAEDVYANNITEVGDIELRRIKECRRF